jgi:hypothetical protein
LLIFKYMMVGQKVLPDLLNAICKSNNTFINDIISFTMLQIVSLCFQLILLFSLLLIFHVCIVL